MTIALTTIAAASLVYIAVIITGTAKIYHLVVTRLLCLHHLFIKNSCVSLSSSYAMLLALSIAI